jgi:hypothetical protein
VFLISNCNSRGLVPTATIKCAFQKCLTLSPSMNALLLELPADALATPGMSLESVSAEAKFMLAPKSFEVGGLSSAKAGPLCGMGRVEFSLAASRPGGPVITLDSMELNAEFPPND